MTASNGKSSTHKALDDFAPALVGYADDVVFGRAWERSELSPRDRSLITVAALVTSGSTDQLVSQLDTAMENGVTEAALVEAITYLAFYAGWPRAMSAMTAAKAVLCPGE